MNAEVRELPLFPLNAVLFPGGPLPLRIFEPRYLDMVSRCMREQSGFAVVLLGEGEEAASATTFAATGTEARIVDFDRLEGGLLGISCIGLERVRVVEAWREADGLNRGRVLDIAADPIVPVPPDQAWLSGGRAPRSCRRPATPTGTWSGATTRPGSPTGWRRCCRSSLARQAGAARAVGPARAARGARARGDRDIRERLARAQPARRATTISSRAQAATSQPV